MKTFLIILLVAVGGFSYFQVNKAKAETVAAKAALADIPKLKAELKTAKADLQTAETDVARLERQVQELMSVPAQAAVPVAEAPAPVPAPAPPVSTGPSAEQVNAKLAELRAIYDRNHQELTAQRSKLTANLSKAQQLKRDMVNNGPQFNEQRTRTNKDSSTSTVGVRMSQADRAEITDKHEAQLNVMSSQIAAIEGEMVALDGRFAALDRAYQDAVAKAQGY